MRYPTLIPLDLDLLQQSVETGVVPDRAQIARLLAAYRAAHAEIAELRTAIADVYAHLSSLLPDDGPHEGQDGHDVLSAIQVVRARRARRSPRNETA